MNLLPEVTHHHGLNPLFLFKYLVHPFISYSWYGRGVIGWLHHSLSISSTPIQRMFLFFSHEPTSRDYSSFMILLSYSSLYTELTLTVHIPGCGSGSLGCHSFVSLLFPLPPSGYFYSFSMKLLPRVTDYS